jgi:hypothetical protein
MLRSGLKVASRAATRVNNGGAFRFMSAKEIKFGVDGRNAMLKGVETLADAVQVCFPRLEASPSEIAHMGKFPFVVL